MGRKKILGVGGVVAVVPDDRPFCFYCDRDFDNIKTLVAHQQTKHFCCVDCGLKFDTTTNLRVHMLNAHKKKLTAVTGAIEGRDNPDYVIHGMDGVPQHVKDARREAAGLPPISSGSIPGGGYIPGGEASMEPPPPAPMGIPPIQMAPPLIQQPPMGGGFNMPMSSMPPPMAMPPPMHVPPPMSMPPMPAPSPMGGMMPNIPEGMKPELPAGLHPAVYLVLGAVPKKDGGSSSNSAMSGVAGLIAGLQQPAMSEMNRVSTKRPGDDYGMGHNKRVMI
jgi:hypothetical protein